MTPETINEEERQFLQRNIGEMIYNVPWTMKKTCLFIFENDECLIGHLISNDKSRMQTDDSMQNPQTINVLFREQILLIYR